MGRVERQWDIPILIIFILPVLHLREDSGGCLRLSVLSEDIEHGSLPDWLSILFYRN